MIRLVLFAVAAWLFLIGVVVQVFLAGAGLFGLTDFTAHAGFGWMLASVPILVLVLAMAALVDRRTVLIALALTVVTIIQPELAAARHDNPVVAALHPVNALLVFWLAWVVARRATELAREAARRPSARDDVTLDDASSPDAA
jgi:Family of unknown function (DUF6220)